MMVATWGSFIHGNFGDDVMAVLFARTVTGATPVVFRMDCDSAQRYDIATEAELEPQLDGSRLVMMGGGAMLADGGVGLRTKPALSSSMNTRRQDRPVVSCGVAGVHR